MKRQAIIIVAPGTKGQKGYLEGALTDAENWRKYLTSLQGGEWYSSEIKIFINENKTVVKQFIDSCTGEYAFVAFSGHGFVNQSDGLTYCKLRENEYLNEQQLMPRLIAKQTISIDSCREVTTPVKFLGLLEKADRVASLSMQKRTTTRALFDTSIAKNLAGTTWLFGAEKNQEADEDSNGGYYTQSVIEGGLDFAKGSTSKEIFDVYDALLASKSLIVKFTKTQKPDIKVGRRNDYFPFAVRLNIHPVYG